MRIALLGELEVRGDDDSNVNVTGSKQRALLAVLALHAGRAVPTDRLVEALWGPDPPVAVRNGLQGLVSKLRRALGSPSIVSMRGGGYVLELAPEAIDVHRYELLVAAGRAAADIDPTRSIALLAEAESLWRGDALAEFSYDEFASVTITRLSELRLAAVEERLEIELRLGRHQGVIGELETLTNAHPLRERPRGLLMIALYRAERQADALRIFQEGRRQLGDELGLEPGPELRRLEAAILAHDPSLDAPVGPDARPAVTPAVTSTWSQHRSPIPASLTPLVGRDAELRDLTRLFDEQRFITLVGPGGVGKTRLALEVARARSATLAFGGCLVELAPVGDPAGVRAAIAFALDLPDPAQLVTMIGERQLLLVLDNCEHLIVAAAAVAEELLQRCPGLQLLATSREGLRVGGETIWPVPPLAASDAAELFIARAEAAGAQLDLTVDTVGAVAEICARLDGLPLAIELAAAQARAFPIPQILSRLTDRFRLLTGGSRTALPRQQTLRAVVDWSYELLFSDEQRVFERLSVFPGGCDLTTAQTVCADDDLLASDVEDIIRALIEKSLVIAAPRAPELRVTLLQTLGLYGRERLAERGESAKVRDAMAAHFATLCRGSAAAFVGEHQQAWLTAMDQERDNIRAAVDWAVANDDAETALTIAGGASWPHWLAGTVSEGKRWLDDAFACRGDASERTRALALTGRGLINLLAGSPAYSDADLTSALAIFRKHNDVASIALTYSFYAELPRVFDDDGEGRRRRLEVLNFYEGLPDKPFAIAARAYSKAKLAMIDGDLVACERHYREATVGFSVGERPVMKAICLGMLADFDERSGRYVTAIEELNEAISLNESVGLRGFNGSLLARLAWVMVQHGDVTRAEIINTRALDVGRRLRNASVLFLALTVSATLHCHRGRYAEAAAAATEALDICRADQPRRFGNRIDPGLEVEVGAALCCTVLGIIASEQGEATRCALFLGHADRIRRDANTSAPAFQLDDIGGAVAASIAVLGPDGFAVAFGEGHRFELDTLVDFGGQRTGVGDLHLRHHEGGAALRPDARQ